MKRTPWLVLLVSSLGWLLWRLRIGLASKPADIQKMNESLQRNAW